jgi:hypothetical protein
MTTNTNYRIETQIDLGCLFAKVVATSSSDSLGNRVVGAHVDLDGTILSDTGLWPIDPSSDEFDVIRAVRQAAHVAIMKAHQEIAAEFDHAESLRVRVLLARELPFPLPPSSLV